MLPTESPKPSGLGRERGGRRDTDHYRWHVLRPHTPWQYSEDKWPGREHTRGTAAGSALPPPPAHPPATPAKEALSWGWGGDGRLATHSFAQQTSPQRLYGSARLPYTSVDCGNAHVVLATADGLVYTAGRGQQGQLGRRKHNYLRFVRAAFPSGVVKEGHDLKIAQVAAGHSACFAREATPREGVDTCFGLGAMLAGVEQQLREDPADVGLAEIRAFLLQEARRLEARFSGAVTAWGSGPRGELGLGLVTQRGTPAVVPALRKRCIRQVAAGHHHALALDDNSQSVYAWGVGADGRLGHGDERDRAAPTIVPLLRNRDTVRVAAGGDHSMALLACGDVLSWGGNAWGQLGHGDERVRRIPRRVEALRGQPIEQLALGEAHSLALRVDRQPVSLGCPLGRVTTVLAWGRGHRGQLGNNALRCEPKPVKSRMPLVDVVVQVAAGWDTSFAITFTGELFSWGSGAHGELGHGNVTSHVGPTPVSSNHCFLRAAGGPAHSIALTYRHERKQERARDILKAYLTGQLDTPESYLGLEQHESQVFRHWVCARQRKHADSRDAVFYDCLDCGLSNVCGLCARRCHRGHRVGPCHERFRRLCVCSLEGRDRCMLMTPVVETPMGQHLAARRIQRGAKGFLARRLAERQAARRRELNSELAGKLWLKFAVQPLSTTLKEADERAVMEAEDGRSRLYEEWYHYHQRLRLMLELKQAMAAELRAHDEAVAHPDAAAVLRALAPPPGAGPPEHRRQREARRITLAAPEVLRSKPAVNALADAPQAAVPELAHLDPHPYRRRLSLTALLKEVRRFQPARLRAVRMPPRVARRHRDVLRSLSVARAAAEERLPESLLQQVRGLPRLPRRRRRAAAARRRSVGGEERFGEETALRQQNRQRAADKRRIGHVERRVSVTDVQDAAEPPSRMELQNMQRQADRTFERIAYERRVADENRRKEIEARRRAEAAAAAAEERAEKRRAAEEARRQEIRARREAARKAEFDRKEALRHSKPTLRATHTALKSKQERPKLASVRRAERKAERERKKAEEQAQKRKEAMGGWEEVVDDADGSVYYFHALLNQTRWELPKGVLRKMGLVDGGLVDSDSDDSTAPAVVLPEGWIQAEEGFYVHEETGDVTWTLPGS